MNTIDTMKFMKGITFAPFHKRGSLSTETARNSFDYMIGLRIQKRYVILQKTHFRMKN